MTTEIKSTQTTRIRALNNELRKDFTSWLSDGTPRWLPHWVNSRTRGGLAPRGSGTINNNSADDGVRGSENERREQCRAVFKGSG